ncbi:endonuclease III [bacterium]|nr:endonuclease III [bacterium]
MAPAPRPSRKAPTAADSVAKQTATTKGARPKTAAPTAPGLEPLRRRRAKAGAIIAALRAEFPDTRCSLAHGDDWQLLVATILSAQCTDARVNQVTPGLFRRFPTPADFAAAPLAEIEEAIRSTGFYRNKAKSLQGAARHLLERHGGRLPADIDELVEVPGCGRKTANVVLGEVHGEPAGVVVDTHVGRISRKLGLTDQDDPVRAERQLNECVPRADWRDFGHLLIDHGRKTCRARAPKCDDCGLYRWCLARS